MMQLFKVVLYFILTHTGFLVFSATANELEDQMDTHLMVHNAYIRAMPPGQTKTAAFFTIVNHSDIHCQWVSAESAIAQHIEFHTHRHVRGVAQMRPVDRIEIPPGQTVKLEPGHLHLMLFGVGQQLMSEQFVALRLNTDRCGTVNVSVPVKDWTIKPMGAMHH
jgi:hypothetical protein